MTTTGTTSASSTRVSLRDLSEAAFRALTAHGASHGEARAAARMVLQAELHGGGGLAALRDDLAAQPWSRTPVEIVETADGPNHQPGAVELRSPGGNRLLREAPLAVELVASGGEERVVTAHCAVAGTALLDAVLLEAARVSGNAVALVIGSATGSDGTGRGATQPSAQVRLARPDGSLGFGILSQLPTAWPPAAEGEGVVALRELEQLGGLDLSWTSANDLTQARAEAAAVGVTVDATAWNTVYTASRRYLVPD
ncbi:MAG: hypothetical protein L0H96_10110 [Humibacillus sp.]|nr:hypothetical protein [Humibacillus sp.]MDN5777254.1 hypothetical protein [Humibacillus sp.]